MTTGPALSPTLLVTLLVYSLFCSRVAHDVGVRSRKGKRKKTGYTDYLLQRSTENQIPSDNEKRTDWEWEQKKNPDSVK